MTQKTALFIGAHPDDLEIGAGGTIAKLCQDRWAVWLIIMTDDANPDIALKRRQEALDAARVLGVENTQILFMGFPDGQMPGISGSDERMPDAVGRLREIIREHSISPQIVFTHSIADDHQDHKACHHLTCAAIRNIPRLYFAIVNHLITSKFAPTIFVDVEAVWKLKIQALRLHKTQADRIKEREVVNLSATYFRATNAAHTEAFEFDMTAGSEDKVELVMSLNSSVFHKLWYPIIENRMLYCITPNPVYRIMQPRMQYNWPSDSGQIGLDDLDLSFKEHWHFANRRHPIIRLRCDQRDVDLIVTRGDILIDGGAVSNRVARDYLNHFEGVRYIIDYRMPEYRDVHVLDRDQNVQLGATYDFDSYGRQTVISDLGILTVMPNPYQPENWIIAATGIHGFGTRGCFKFLSEPVYIAQLINHPSVPHGAKGYQLLVSYNVDADDARIVDGTLHIMER